QRRLEDRLWSSFVYRKDPRRYSERRSVRVRSFSNLPFQTGEAFMNRQQCQMILLVALLVGAAMIVTQRTSASGGDSILDDQLSQVLTQHGFTGTVGSSLERRLGRRIDNQL